jgi:hypothetical protein
MRKPNTSFSVNEARFCAVYVVASALRTSHFGTSWVASLRRPLYAECSPTLDVGAA